MLLVLQRSSVWLALRVGKEEIYVWKELKMPHQMYNLYFETRKKFLGIVVPQFFLAIKSVKSQRMITK